MEREDGHWTDNPEMIERFVLHKLNPDVLNELEDHLRVCEVCKQAVRAEQIIVAGIRRSGRQRFKQELRKKLAAEPVEKTPWMQILSAAAVVVILLTVGLYNNWFSIQRSKDDNTVALTSPQPEAAQPLKGRADSEAKNESPATTPPESGRKASAKQNVSPPASIASEETDVSRQSEVAPGEMKQNGGAPAITAESGQAKSIELQSATPADAGLWVEGKVLPPDGTLGESLAKGHRYDLQGYGPKGKSDIRLKSETKQRQDGNVQGNIYSLRQQNSVSLQPQQQRLQKKNSGIVITKIERVGSETQLTMFVDSLVDEHELTNATIETPTDDSLIVNLSSRRIAYRLPSGWNAQIQVRPAR